MPVTRGTGDEEDAPASKDRGSATAATTIPTSERVRRICPYLMADGGWRSVRPIPGHRCTAVEPAELLPLNTQRELCLGDGHVDCPAFIAAATRRREELVRAGIPPERLERSRVAATTRPVPVALDRPQRGSSHSRLRVFRRSLAGAGLGIAAVLAALTIMFARAPEEPPSSSPGAAALGGAGATAAATPESSVLAATATPAATATARRASPTPTETPESRIYRVESGDTLSGIAARFDTTVAVLVELNDIEDPSRLQIGQELRLP